MSGGGTHCLQGADKKLAAAYHGADDIRRVAPDQAEPVSQRRRRASKPRDGGSVGKDSGAGSLAGILLGGDWGNSSPPGMAETRVGKPKHTNGQRWGMSRGEPRTGRGRHGTRHQPATPALFAN